jgi:hypothetical protein
MLRGQSPKIMGGTVGFQIGALAITGTISQTEDTTSDNNSKRAILPQP